MVYGVTGENGQHVKEHVINVEQHQEIEHVQLKAAAAHVLEIQLKQKRVM